MILLSLRGTGVSLMIRPHDLAIYPLPLIRRVAPSDIEAIVAIEKESFIDPWEPSVFFEALTCFPTTYFVAVCDGTVPVLSLADWRTRVKTSTGTCELWRELYLPARGIGRLLLRRLEHQFALGLATDVQLEVRVGNTTAQRFYRRLGYRDIFQIEGYYSDGEDALVMMKWFRF